jgi:peptide chain release factor subunit 1
MLFASKLFISGKYFDEISQDTGKYCFGVDDTMKALDMGAVETLIVWENLDVMRLVYLGQFLSRDSVSY